MPVEPPTEPSGGVMSSGQGGRSAKRAAVQSLPYILSSLLFVACSEPTAPGVERINLDVVSPPPPPAPPPATGTGQTAFAAACASCHPARDAFDLAYFSYSDTNIVRRALAHVSSATASSIVAYIHTIVSPHVPEAKLLWQPGGSVVTGASPRPATSILRKDYSVWMPGRRR